MCYAYGSIDQAVNVCVMCKVFPGPRSVAPKIPVHCHIASSCPHTRDVCRNRTAHPRFDVLYLKNAEVDSFNGCGYCKVHYGQPVFSVNAYRSQWARTNPPPKAAGYYNTGWPGCCRPPTASEHRLIQPADWRSVSLGTCVALAPQQHLIQTAVHHVPIPADVKAALDNLSSRGSPVPSASPVRSGPSAKPAIPPVDRRNSASGRTAKSAAMPIPTKGRSGGSPQMVASSITSTSSRGSGSSGGTSASIPAASTMELQAQRRRDTSADAEKPPGPSNFSPGRKQTDLENPFTPRRNSSGRPPASAASSSVSKVIADALTSGTQRHRSLSSAQSSTPAKSSPPASKTSPPVRPVDPPRSQKKADAENLSASSSSSKKADVDASSKKKDVETASSSSGSDSLGSMTESTVTSDGGFTDYLSDESEAELQRQAEAKAALVAQNEAEELEFRAARQALANIGLRPPKSWAATDTNRSAARIAPSTRS
ncbi:hypothetical protein C8R47DRAFT_771972 [Mycena vitilis]|nr:hypothetical protein C8R47DRAFT_771972 [Mycena vitilis]